MIKYLGSKRLLLPAILELTQKLPNNKRILDLFSGTSRVGHAYKAAGHTVTANDINTYAYTLAKCYVEADRDVYEKEAAKIIAELNELSGNPGYFTESFCVNSRFIQPHNGERIDAIRERIAQLGLDPVLEGIVLVSLMEAADRVDSTCGVQMAYLKSWAKRSENKLELRVPNMLPGSGRAWLSSAEDACSRDEFDVVYLDPPYNQHNYLGNYHIWESLVLWDKPELYGKAMKRVDVKQRKSSFNSKKSILEAFSAVISGLRTKYIIVSFNNEGYLSKEDILGCLGDRETITVDTKYKRYVGSQIGVFNKEGKKVGKEGAKFNIEHTFVAGDGVSSIFKE